MSMLKTPMGGFALVLFGLLGTQAVAQSSGNGADQTARPAAAETATGEVTVRLGQGPRSPDELKQGLFPEDFESPEQRSVRERCERLRQSGVAVCAAPALSYTRYVLPGAYFDLGSSELTDVMKGHLQAFAKAMQGKAGPAPLVRLEGHTDITGPAQINALLSRQRAESVRDYLVSLGVSSSVLATEGFGADHLLKPDQPASSENRRVELARVRPTAKQ